MNRLLTKDIVGVEALKRKAQKNVIDCNGYLKNYSFGKAFLFKAFCQY